MNLKLLFDWFNKLDPEAVQLVTRFLVTAFRSPSPKDYIIDSLQKMMRGEPIMLSVDELEGSTTISQLVLSLIKYLSSDAAEVVQEYIKYTGQKPSDSIRKTIVITDPKNGR